MLEDRIMKSMKFMNRTTISAYLTQLGWHDIADKNLAVATSESEMKYNNLTIANIRWT